MISFEFVADNFEVLEADFQREYGINLREVLYGPKPMGGRRLTALINGLTPTSATMRKVNSGGLQWSSVEELLATLCEMVDLTNRLLYSGGNFDTKKVPVWDPLEIPRPYTQEEKQLKRREPSSPDEVRSMFTTGELGVVVYDPTPQGSPVLVSSDEEQAN